MSEYNIHADKINAINAVFKSQKAWAYAVMYHGVAIGTWEDGAENFHTTIDFSWENVIELRVFNSERELRFVRGEDGKLLFRDSANIVCDETRDTAYLMYGTSAQSKDGWTIFSEDRGGNVYFPKEITFDAKDGNAEVVMWLGIRNYLRFTEDLRLEVFDYAFTGFMQGLGNDGKYKQEVKL